jgi:pyruvate,orthophosphate dikinase
MTDDPTRLALIGIGQQNMMPAAEYGNKAAGLAEMASLGVPVPPGFALPVDICREYFLNGGVLGNDVPRLLRQGIEYIERATGTTFGGVRHPLLVSVRSAAPVSMPGVMDTILNVGLTPSTVRGLLAYSGNPRFVYDTFRRFLANFGTSIFGHPPSRYILPLKEMIKKESVADERELDYQSLRTLCTTYEQLYSAPDQRECLKDAHQQLVQGTIAVIRSWASPRAEAFRSTHLLSGVSGTAVTVQAMVFGNMGASSGAGVAFTRNPWNGGKEMLIDFRFGAQGEDVVSGDREATTHAEISDVMPDVYHDLIQIGTRLETHYRDMQDLEFTVQEGRLYLLQSRSGKCAPLATLQIAVDLYEEHLISQTEALERLHDIDLDSIKVQTVEAHKPPIAFGISASGGVAYGSIALSSNRAEQDGQNGPVILVRETASPDDIAGVDISAGLLTACGARTSHAAVVARQLGKVCVVNCTVLSIEPSRHRCTIGGVSFQEGDIISIDGNTGAVYHGRVTVKSSRPDHLIDKVQRWKVLAD